MNIKKHLIKCFLMLFTFYFFRIITIVSIGLYNKIDLNIGFVEWIKAIFFFGSFPGVDLAHMWFIPTLFAFYTITPFIIEYFNKEKPLNNNYFLPFMLLLFLISFICGDLPIILEIIFGKSVSFSSLGNLVPFSIRNCGFLLYFLLGAMMSKYREKLKKIKCYFLILILLLGILLLGLYWFFMHRFWDFIFESYTLFPVILITSAIYLLCLKIDNSKIEKNKKQKFIIKIFGENTLFVYYLHWIFGYTILKTILSCISYQEGFLPNMLKGMSLVIISSLIGWLCKKIRDIFRRKV